MKQSCMYGTVLILILLAATAWAQQNATNSGTAATACTFEDGKEISIRYHNTKVHANKKLPNGKLWMPGNKPMYLFTQADVKIGDRVVPSGAYAVYLMPDKDSWTLIVNSDVTPGSPYDEKEDVARTSLELGQLSDAQPFQLVFGHVGPKRCSLRVYLGKIGAWADLWEQ